MNKNLFAQRKSSRVRRFHGRLSDSTNRQGVKYSPPLRSASSSSSSQSTASHSAGIDTYEKKALAKAATVGLEIQPSEIYQLFNGGEK